MQKCYEVHLWVDKVAVIGAGGIGFDVSEFLLKPATSTAATTIWQIGNVNGV